MPYEIAACAGKPYMPSNGTEGMRFEEEFCERCARENFDEATGEGGCHIHFRALCGVKGPPEWTHDFKGRPTCTSFVERHSGEDDGQPPDVPDQLFFEFFAPHEPSAAERFPMAVEQAASP